MPSVHGPVQRLAPALLLAAAAAAAIAIGLARPAVTTAAELALAEEPVPAAPNTWYARSAFAALRAADEKRDPKAAAAAALNSGLADGIARLSGLAPAWLRRSDIAVRLSDDLRPGYDLATTQPLYRGRSGSDTVFVQGRLALAPGAEDNTGTARVGYRRFVYGDRILLGASSFYARARPDENPRVGIGAEIRSRPVEVSGSFYGALPPEPDPAGPSAAATTAADTVEEAFLEGFDLEVSGQLPYLPWARLYGETFWRQVNVLGDTTEGERFGLRLNPLPPLRLEFGGVREGDADPEYFARLRYTRALGRPPPRRGPLLDHDALTFDDARAAYGLDALGE